MGACAGRHAGSGCRLLKLEASTSLIGMSRYSSGVLQKRLKRCVRMVVPEMQDTLPTLPRALTCFESSASRLVARLTFGTTQSDNTPARVQLLPFSRISQLTSPS